MTVALLVQKTNSPKIIESVGALLPPSPFSVDSCNPSNSFGYFSNVERVFYEEQTTTPELLDINNKLDRYKAARGIFPTVRDFSEDELLQLCLASKKYTKWR